MKITGFIIGFNALENIMSDVTIKEQNGERRVKIDLTREEVKEMIRAYGVDKLVTVTVGDGGDL